jgi:hypothetical protein
MPHRRGRTAALLAEKLGNAEQGDGLIYSHYDIESIRSVWRHTKPTITIPISSRDGGLADATYRYLGRNEPEDGHHRSQLVSIVEWMPALHPSLKNRPDRKACVGADGQLDLEAEAAQRRREWAHMTEIEGDPFYEDDDE